MSLNHEQPEKNKSSNRVKMYSLHDIALLRLTHLLLVFLFNQLYC